MLMLNLKPILAARGIERPYSFLVKSGFTPSAAHKLLHSKTSTFRLIHVEKLCTLLNCTPNDLLLWVSNRDEIVNESHPLISLKKPAIAPTNWLQALKEMSLQDLAKITEIISNYKNKRP